MKRATKLTVILALAAAAVVIGTKFTNAKGGNGPPQCPDIYAPVICDGGEIYPNLCYANRAHATNCVPYGDDL